MILIQMRASVMGKSSLYIRVPKDVERKKIVDYTQGRMTNWRERRHSWDAPELLGGVSWIQLGALDPAQGCQCPEDSSFSYSGLGDLFPLALEKPLLGQAGRELPWALPSDCPLRRVCGGGHVHTNKNYKHTKMQNVNLPVCVQAVHTSRWKKMKHCSAQIWVWWEEFRTFQMNAVSVTCNSTLLDCLQIIDLNLFSVHVQDKPDSFQSKLFFYFPSQDCIPLKIELIIEATAFSYEAFRMAVILQFC